MTTHWDQVEADFQRFYSIDLRGACYGASPLGSRRLMTLLRGLPPDSNLNRVLYPDAEWGYNEELLALLAELMDYGNRLSYAVAPFKHKKKQEPIRIPRPHQRLVEKPKASHEEIVAFFQGSSN